MKRYVFKVILFAFLFLIVNYIYLELVKKYDWNFSKSVEISDFQNQDFECIVLGNSLALDGIDTNFLMRNGIKSYNFALGGTGLKSNYIQLKEYLNVNKKPKIILLGLDSSLKNYKSININESVHPVIDYCYNERNLKIDNLPMIKFKWLAAENFKKLISKDHRDAKLVHGQLKIKRSVPDNSKYKDEVNKTVSIEDYKGAKYLFKIDSICKRNNIKLLNIEMPGFKKTQNEIPIGPNFIKDSVNSLILYNLNNKELCKNLFDHNKDWLGNSHLNEYGARKLTNHIYEKILKDKFEVRD